MRFKAMGIAASAALATIPMMANAAVVTRTYTVRADSFGPGAPVDPVSGSFTVTFDNAGTVTNEVAGLTVNNLNLTIDSPIGYTYDPSFDLLFFGGLFANVVGVTSLSNDFGFGIFNSTAANVTSPATTNFIYSNTGTFYSTFNVMVTASDITSSVPEPTSWALMIGGFGLVGGTLRARPRKIAFTAA